MTDRDAMIEAVARALCKSGEFETGHGTCAWICMDQLGEARKGPCLHAETVHRDLATTALEAAEPFILAREQAAFNAGQKAMREAAAKVAEHYWVEADYNLVGIADADMAMELCKQSADAIHNLKIGEE